MNKYEKGAYGYLRAYRRSKLVMSIIFAAMIEFIVITLLLQFGTTKHVMIVIAVLLSLPFAKFLISFLMCVKFKPLAEEEYEKIKEKTEKQTGRMLYDLGISQYEGMRFFPAICVKNSHVYALVLDKAFEDRKKDYEKWLSDCLGEGKNKVIISVFSDMDAFVKKVNSTSEPKESIRRIDKNIAEKLLDNSI